MLLVSRKQLSLMPSPGHETKGLEIYSIVLLQLIFFSKGLSFHPWVFHVPTRGAPNTDDPILNLSWHFLHSRSLTASENPWKPCLISSRSSFLLVMFQYTFFRKLPVFCNTKPTKSKSHAKIFQGSGVWLLQTGDGLGCKDWSLREPGGPNGSFTCPWKWMVRFYDLIPES